MMHRTIQSMILGGFWMILSVPGTGLAAGSYQQTDLITSATDPDLINPWGISYGPTGPFWVSDNGTGKTTLYNGAGTKLGLVVSMPSGSEPITGQVFNGTASFKGNAFLFASENGTIAGWRPALGTSAESVFAVPGAVYKGLAISDAKDRLYAANFHSGAIDVFDSTHSAPIASFIDPVAPAGYAPFNIQNLGGRLIVTFALQNGAGHDDVAGVGHGIVDIFDPATDAFTRLITGSAAGGPVTALDSPWGVALAPSGFGKFGGSLLVANFGDGVINAFDPTSGALLGSLDDGKGKALVNPGVWGLTFGNGGSGGNKNLLYFTAGGAGEDIGVFGQIKAVPEPGSMLIGLIGAGLVIVRWRSGRRC